MNHCCSISFWLHFSWYVPSTYHISSQPK